MVDPDGADAELGRQLAEEERLARCRTSLRLHDHGDGTTEGRFRIPTLHAEMLRKALDRLPSAGGVNATVVVTMTLDQLRAELATASIDTGAVLSAGEARRLACEAGLIPMVLGGDSVALDVGREQRLHTRYQRIALAQRYQTCASVPAGARPPGPRPTTRCHPWSRGGATSVANGELPCSWHHHRAHDPDYDLTRLPDGSVRFHRRS